MPLEHEAPLVARAQGHVDRAAIEDAEGTHSYRDLLTASERGATALLAAGEVADDLAEERLAFLVPPGLAWAAVLLGIWRAGGIAVPLAVSHPRGELEHVIADSGAAVLVAHPDLSDRLKPIAAERGLPLLITDELLDAAPPSLALPAITPSRRSMILYTSGTTGRPKGVVTTHGSLQCQIESLVEAWGWREDDRILHVLPLHHTHGIVNALLCALWSGAACEMLPRFDAGGVWRRFADETAPSITLFMAVPTIYTRLIAAWEAAPAAERRAWSAAAGRLRLMVSGSAALPVAVLERWREITGQTLLERYGMTEIGMALSNPLAGDRVPGAVGRPLPGVEARLVDDAGRPVADGTPGEIEVRGPGVFLEYWRRPKETRAAFHDGWFQTGDDAVVEDGVVRILGRRSVDILKTGGYKVSALEIEAVLADHPEVAECAVVGADDPEWGQRIAAAVVVRAGAAPTLDDLRAWAGERLAPYKLPTRLLLLDALPRNALGKVLKPELTARFAVPGGSPADGSLRGR
jgi:malonyl-CoA/methylmalonyl-CoA synthetase